MIEIRTLSVAEMQEQGADLLKAHYEELTRDKEVVKLNVDWVKYSVAEQKGILVSLGLWEDGILIGYSVFFKSSHAHYKAITMALNDVLFLRHDKRKGSLGIKLIRASEKCLKEQGVTKVLWHCKYGTVLGPILERIGYANEEYTMGKLLGD